MAGMGVRRQGRIWLALLAFALGFVVATSLDGSGSSAAGSDEAYTAIGDALSLIDEKYIDEVQPERLIEAALEGIVAALDDEYSVYIRPEVYQRSIDFTGEFTGIGVTVDTDAASGSIVVATLVDGAPAQAAGVLPGDIFLAVDGRDVRGYSQEELSLLVPGERGTYVQLTMQRGQQELVFDILRDRFVLPNVSYQIVGEDIAHITMLDFHDLSRQQFDAALAALDVNARAGLIFDLRGNPGGTLSSAVDIAGSFVPKAVILRELSRDRSETVTRSSATDSRIRVPVVLLVNAASASAAEVLAGALQDHGAALILGEPTIGKDTVQTIHKLANGGGLRLTVGRWLMPGGGSVHERGLQPDIIVAGDKSGTADAQLQAAIDYITALPG